MSKNTTILFYGSLGNKKSPILGGGTTGNYHTIGLLQKKRMNVIKLHKPYPPKHIFRYIVYPFMLLVKIVDFILTLASKPKISIVHIGGSYFHLAYIELVLISLAKVFNKKCIYELKAGGVIKAYQTRSFVYRFVFKSALKKANVVLCQGALYVPFLNKITKTKIIHYSNYVTNEFLPNRSLILNDHYNRRFSECMKLVYFGRITKTKNIELIIEICNELNKRHVFFDINLIGFLDKKYMKKLNETIIKNNLSTKVTFINPLSKAELKDILMKKHFFIFPSNEKREGQSNSLTEAMAAGVVPVCSTAGFNKEIVNESSLIVQDNMALSYANIIISIWENGSWFKYSKKVFERVLLQYTEQKAIETLKKVYGFKH